MEKQTKILLTLILILLIIGGYFFITQVFNPALEKRLEDRERVGFDNGIRMILAEQTTKGKLYYIDLNRTVQVIGLQELCSGGL